MITSRHYQRGLGGQLGGPTPPLDTKSNASSCSPASVPPHQQQRRSRAGRVRTVLSEKQLNLLKSCYTANPRPDALMKEQLVEMTGLSPRVVRVWFQNKRCKDKKKMSTQRGKDGRKLSYASMHGIPMIASSPLRHDHNQHHPQHHPLPPQGPMPMPPHQVMPPPVDIHSYEPPWKALCDFALHSDLEKLNPNAPNYQQLVNEMHGFDPNDPNGPDGVLPPPLPPPQEHYQPPTSEGDLLFNAGPLPPHVGDSFSPSEEENNLLAKEDQTRTVVMNL